MDQIQQSRTYILPGHHLPYLHATYNPQSFAVTKPQPQLSSLYAGYLSIDQNSQPPTLALSHDPTIYIPTPKDYVIGIIRVRTSESYIVDINGTQDCVLGGLEFDGATKRNRPNLAVGGVVYCRVTEWNRFVGGKLSCINKGYNTKDELGQLKGGMLLAVPRYRHGRLVDRLGEIGKLTKFEVAFGKNGIIWVNSANHRTTVLLYNIFSQVLQGCKQELYVKLLAMLN